MSYFHPITLPMLQRRGSQASVVYIGINHETKCRIKPPIHHSPSTCFTNLLRFCSWRSSTVHRGAAWRDWFSFLSSRCSLGTIGCACSRCRLFIIFSAVIIVLINIHLPGGTFRLRGGSRRCCSSLGRRWLLYRRLLFRNHSGLSLFLSRCGRRLHRGKWSSSYRVVLNMVSSL